MPTAVVLVSGGLDSCVTASIAARSNELAFLHLNYHQRTQARELRAFNELAEHFSAAKRLVVDLSYMQQIGGSSLIDQTMPVPEGEEDEGVPSTYVPFRNANLLGIGVAWAEVLGAQSVHLGAHQEQSPYPDCRREFIDTYNKMVATGTHPQSHITVRAPLIDLDKAAIVRRGLEIDAPFGLTWSCYQNEKSACGRCASCRLRLKGFALAGVQDPLPYAK